MSTTTFVIRCVGCNREVSQELPLMSLDEGSARVAKHYGWRPAGHFYACSETCEHEDRERQAKRRAAVPKFTPGQRVRVTTRRGPPQYHGVVGTVVRYDDSPIPARVDLDGFGERGFADWELTPLESAP